MLWRGNVVQPVIFLDFLKATFMSTLYIDRKNVRLDYDAEALVFYENNERIGTVPLAPLQRVIIRGNVTVDTTLLGKMGMHGIGIIILSGRKAEPSLFLPRAHNDAARRIAQYRAATDVARCLTLSRHIVRTKLISQLAFLKDKLESRPDARYELNRAMQGLGGMLESVAQKPVVAELRGLEGAAANLYFSALAAMAPASLNFHNRNRRPPRDPLNAVLSLGYTLLHAEAILAAHAVGLDPYIGFYHVPAFGRESLASDAWALGLFNSQTLRTDDFSSTQEGCYLGKAGRERFYRAWEPLAENLRKLMDAQTRTLITLIGAGEDDASEAELRQAWAAWASQEATPTAPPAPPAPTTSNNESFD
jgi:CRISP-associated protein Cas1